MESENSTVSASYYAVRGLLYDESNQETLRELKEVSSFLYSCQTGEGGFAEIPVNSGEEEEKEALGKIDSPTTLKALFTLHTLAKVGVAENNLLSEFSSVDSSASAYIRGCVKGGKGVRVNLNSNLVDITANHLFLELAQHFEEVDFGTVSEVKSLLITLAIAFAVYGAFNFYKEQLGQSETLKESIPDASKEVRNAFLLGSVSLASLFLLPQFSLLFYLILFVHIGMRIYDYASTDTTQGEYLTIATLSAVLQFVLLFLLNNATKGVAFTNFTYYYLFVVWFFISAFSSSFLSVSLSQNRKPSLYFASAFTSWTFSFFTTVIFLNSINAWPTLLTLLSIHGQLPLFLLGLPLLSLFLSYPACLLAITI